MVKSNMGGVVRSWRSFLVPVTSSTSWARTFIISIGGRGETSQSRERPFVLLELQGLSTGSATDDWSQSWGYERCHNPLPSSSGRFLIRLTTIGSEAPLNQLSGEPDIGWVSARGIGKTVGENGSISTEAKSPIHGLQERGRGQVVELAVYPG